MASQPTWRPAQSVLAAAAGDFSRSWRTLAAVSLTWRVIGLAVLTPLSALVLHYLLSRTASGAVADADIARLYLESTPGILALVAGGVVAIAFFSLELASLMTVGLVASRGGHLAPLAALRFTASRGAAVLAASAHILVRLVAGLAPFLAAGALAGWLLLPKHDINYYLAHRPQEFWIAATIAGLLGAGIGAFLLSRIARWALAIPLVVFERCAPRRALGESASRSAGRRALVLVLFAVWAGGSIATSSAAFALLSALGRFVAPHLGGSMTLLLSFIAALAAAWGVTLLAVGIVTTSMLALLLGATYRHASAPAAAAPLFATGDRDAPGRLPRPVLAGFVAMGLFGATGVCLVALLVARVERPVLVIAHRGASAEAPENSLAAFRRAIEEKADFVELDVQESLDGVVVVVHDSDLMKVGGSPMKIWESTAEQLRSVDIGSSRGAAFAGERVPTLEEVFELCRGRIKVLVELKSYGHDERLEERVVELVEAARMEDQCAFMSLDRKMVEKMKHLRPAWRVGLLATKTLGDVGALQADFLAVLSRGADILFVRRAHRSGDVYVWTVNDPVKMLQMMGRGVDGLITDRPGVAREAIESRAAMSDAERILTAVMIRLNGGTEELEEEGALRP